VRKSFDIYNCARILERAYARIKESGIDEANKLQILKFLEDLTVLGFSKPRIIKYAEILLQLAKLMNTPFEKAEKADLFQVVKEIESRDYSDWTKRDFKIVLKKFFKWLRKSEDYPEEVRWIKARVRNNKKLPEELLSLEEVNKMAEVATNARDKAFVLLLYETGCRIGEILTLRIKNVQFDNHGAYLVVTGKTGDRRVRIVSSIPKLSQWIDLHPFKDDPDYPLWISLGTNSRHSILTYRAACEIIRNLAKIAGIKKRIYPHLFRHSRATHLANHLTEAQMKQYFGWVQGSSMAATYVHLSGRDIDKAILKLHGLDTEEKKEEEFKLIKCPRCNQSNSPGTKSCNYCGLVLDLKTAMELEETQKKANDLLNTLIKDPEVLDSLVKAVEQIASEKNKKKNVNEQ